MDLEQAILAAILDDPLEEASWAALADWLEEQGDPRGELLRLTRSLLHVGGADRSAREERVCELLAAGVRPCWPVRSNSLGMRFAWCPPGSFLMGSPPDEEGRASDEIQHSVTLTMGFYLSVTPVTQAQWRSVLGNNPSRFQGDDRPVESISWEDCQGFCRVLSKLEGRRYRLPTEAEWEYACRAGTTTPFHFGPTISTDQANFDGNYTYGKAPKGVKRQKTTPAEIFPPNAWGLLAMHGNVLEWCQDKYGPYRSHEVSNPHGQQNADYRVLRGGCWDYSPWGCRSADRRWRPRGASNVHAGCRVVLCLD
jgi:uncharacterized protein (TIGR02996 family)